LFHHPKVKNPIGLFANMRQMARPGLLDHKDIITTNYIIYGDRSKMVETNLEYPQKCLREGYQGMRFIPRQAVSKKIVDAPGGSALTFVALIVFHLVAGIVSTAVLTRSIL
jgi:hypothetical protein